MNIHCVMCVCVGERWARAAGWVSAVDLVQSLPRLSLTGVNITWPVYMFRMGDAMCKMQKKKCSLKDYKKIEI